MGSPTENRYITFKRGNGGGNKSLNVGYNPTIKVTRLCKASTVTCTQ